MKEYKYDINPTSVSSKELIAYINNKLADARDEGEIPLRSSTCQRITDTIKDPLINSFSNYIEKGSYLRSMVSFNLFFGCSNILSAAAYSCFFEGRIFPSLSMFAAGYSFSNVSYNISNRKYMFNEHNIDEQQDNNFEKIEPYRIAKKEDQVLKIIKEKESHNIAILDDEVQIVSEGKEDLREKKFNVDQFLDQYLNSDMDDEERSFVKC